MTAQDILAIVRPPLDLEEEKQLVKQNVLLRWLESQLTDERIVLYGSAYDGSSVFVHSVLVPTDVAPVD